MMLIKKSFSGFTLIELMAVVVIAGILAVLAVPSFQGFLASSQVDSTASNLYSAVLVARNEAISSNTNITLCLSANLTGCNDAAGNSNWNQGWIVTTGARIIKVWERITNVQILAGDPTNLNPLARANQIVFQPDSSTNPANGITFTINQGATTQFVIVNGAGKPRVSDDGS